VREDLDGEGVVQKDFVDGAVLKPDQDPLSVRRPANRFCESDWRVEQPLALAHALTENKILGLARSHS